MARLRGLRESAKQVVQFVGLRVIRQHMPKNDPHRHGDVAPVAYLDRERQPVPASNASPSIAVPPSRLLSGSGVTKRKARCQPSGLAPPSWADAGAPPEGAWCRACYGHRFWIERAQSHGWRCMTCHPPARPLRPEEVENAENSPRTARRVIGRPFRKGVSPNPGGRPKSLVNVQELAGNAEPSDGRPIIDLSGPLPLDSSVLQRAAICTSPQSSGTSNT